MECVLTVAANALLSNSKNDAMKAAARPARSEPRLVVTSLSRFPKITPTYDARTLPEGGNSCNSPIVRDLVFGRNEKVTPHLTAEKGFNLFCLCGLSRNRPGAYPFGNGVSDYWKAKSTVEKFCPRFLGSAVSRHAVVTVST